MRIFKADLHNHTTLSPCGDIEMTPKFIIGTSNAKGYDIIGITDHNSTLQAKEIQSIVGNGRPFILCGAEITTSEEVHVLAFVRDEQLEILQNFIDKHIAMIPNDEEKFGYQLVVDMEENVLFEVEHLLISALNVTIEEIEHFVHSLNGIFIPAHIDKLHNSILSQLGFIPKDLKCDAFEISKRCKQGKEELKKTCNGSIIRSSDAHYPEDFCSTETYFHIDSLSFDEIKMALNGINGRYVTYDVI